MTWLSRGGYLEARKSRARGKRWVRQRAKRSAAPAEIAPAWNPRAQPSFLSRRPRPLRELRLLRSIRRTLEVQAVAVGVVEYGIPKTVTHLRLRCLNPARSELVIERDGVPALEPQRRALAKFCTRRQRVQNLLPAVLQH